MNANLYQLFASRFPGDLSAPFIETEEGRIHSYRDLDAHTARYASFMTGLGLAKGDRVAAQVDKSPEALFVYLACVRAGLVFLPLNTAYQKAEIEYFLGDANPRLVLCRPESFEMVRDVAARAGIAHVFTLDEDGNGSFAGAAAKAQPEFQTVECAPDDLAALIYTSGTTGRSKGAMLSHCNLASNALVLHEYWGWQRGDVLLHALPIFHVHGLFVACHCALLNGSKMVWLKKFDAPRIMEFLPKATVFMGVPTFYARLLEEPRLTPQVCRNMRLFISGSAPLLEETFRAFLARTGHAILERYGMSETIMITSNPLHRERIAGTVGLPLPGVVVRVVDDHGKLLGPGGVGHIQLKGDNVFLGYWRMPEKTREEFTEDGYFKTGDMGRWEPNGYLSIVGRSKDLVITGGYNVYPKEIELVIDAMPGVVESAVVGVPHPDLGEAVTAIVVKDPKMDLTEAAVIAHVKSQLANYKVPKQVFFVQHLPRNAMGKVQKNVLRETCSTQS